MRPTCVGGGGGSSLQREAKDFGQSVEEIEVQPAAGERARCRRDLGRALVVREQEGKEQEQEREGNSTHYDDYAIPQTAPPDTTRRSLV